MRYSRVVQITYMLYIIYAVCFNSTVHAEEYGEPVVAREQLKLMAGEEIVDTIEAGDLLTVLEELEDAYVVITFRGKRGVVTKAYAAKLAESVEVYDKLIANDAKQGRLHALRANAWWARGSIERALEDFDRAIELGKEDPDGYCHRGLCHAALGKHEEAIRDYSVAIELDPEHEGAYINRAAAYMAQRSYGAALKDYSEAIGLNGGKRASTFEQRAVAWKEVGVFDKSLADFGRALELKPESVTALMGRGFLWFQTDHPERAIADFSQVIEINPAEAQAYNNRGFNYRLVGEHERAVADFRQAIRIDRDYALAYQNLAWMYASAEDEGVRDGKRAVQAATKACELNDYKDPTDLKALAAAFAEIGDFGKAVGWHERATAMLPEADRVHEEEITQRYRAEKPFRLTDASGAESNGVPSEQASATRNIVEVTLRNGASSSALNVYLGEASATGGRPVPSVTRVVLKPGEEKSVECNLVLCYYTGLKWKNVYVIEEGLVTFSVQQLGPNSAQWIDAFVASSD